MKILYLSFSFLVLLVCQAYSQDIKGQVSTTTGSPLEGVYLYNISSHSHAHTDEAGHFQLRNTKAGDSLKVSHVGFESRTILASSANLHVVLLPASFQLNEVVVSEGVNHLSSVSAIDLQTNPVNSAQELLRKVPGLFIGQHAGGGKAEQLFLRGFDLDHGTDINISVDGMPVNMVSHAHGQGYADLHFLIPETVGNIDFDKGPYHADKGNMATAGYVSFNTKDRLENSSLTFEGGQFNTYKALGLFNLLNTAKQSAYVAADYIRTDGYFEAPQDFKRLNLMGKYTLHLNHADKLSIAASTFSSQWDASGQIPQRAVDQGIITRFGAIDSNEGGETGRTNVNVHFDKYIDESSLLKTSAYYSRYNFELYSNFTFFLNDPVNGDQIRQKEQRNLAGFESVYNKNYRLSRADLKIQSGLGLRYDDVNNIELSHTLNRSTVLNPIMVGNLNESNAYGFLNAELEIGKLMINPSVRLDYLDFKYQNHLDSTTLQQGKAIISPKLNFLYNQSKDLQFFLKLGKGFHSNDTRVVVAQQGQKVLPAAYGADLGTTWKPAPRLIINAALWYLYLQQEFVYVGDEGVVEPSGRTARKGVDLGLRYQLLDRLFFNTDMTYTHARTKDEAPGKQYIPLAPKFTLAAGLNLKDLNRFSASVRARYLASRPANEDNSIVAKGYFITDANAGYDFGKFNLGVIVENVFNRSWNETQFATTSRLSNEPAEVTEIHFTPGTPFNIRGVLSYRF